MKRILRVLNGFWLLSIALWLLGMAACLWLVPRFSPGLEPLAIALALVTAVWLFAVVLRKFRQVRLERNLEDLVRLEVEREAASAGSRSTELEVLRTRLRAALEMLRAQRRVGGKAALSGLPWYLVVGLSASGKTSLLTRSGLHANVAGGAGLGSEIGTQYCDWYFGSEAVMIDTAGRYVADDQPASEFAEFLKLLARGRRRCPINGLVVVVDLAALLQAPREENHALAQRLIERIDDYRGALRSAPPVYLFFSKADLLPGFVEAFAELDDAERRKPWGITFSVAELRGAGLNQVFSQRFAVLIEALRGFVERRLALAEGSADSTLLRFPDYVAELQGRLADFLEPFDLKRTPDRAPLTRGIYFTSALQSGERLPLILDAEGRNEFALKFEPAEAHGRGAQGTTSFFIHDAFHQLLFRDANLAQHYSRDGHRRSLNPWLVGTAGLAGLAILAALGYSYADHREALARIDQRLAVQQQDPAAVLDTLRDALAGVHQDNRNGTSLTFDMGLDQGPRLRPALESAYFAALERQALAPLAQALGARLLAVGELAASLGIETRPAQPGERLDQGTALESPRQQGQRLGAESLADMRERLSERPTLGSLPRSPGELAGRLRQDTGQRLRGGVDEAYWSTRQGVRDALREGIAEGAPPSWWQGQGEAPGAADAGGYLAFSEAALSHLQPAQVGQLIEAYDALKLYLILTDPAAHPEVGFVRLALPRAWRQWAPDATAQAERIDAHVALYADYLERGAAPALARDQALVDEARAGLKGFLVDSSLVDREYLRYQLEVDERYPALTLATMVTDQNRALLYAGESVPAFYTREVWEGYLRGEILRTLASNLDYQRDWVLDSDEGGDPAQERGQFVAELMARYKRDYIAAWERFLTDVGVRRFDGLEVSAVRLSQFSDYQRSPLKQLLAVVDANTAWDRPGAESAGAEPRGEAAQREAPGLWQRAAGWLGGAGAEAADQAAALGGLPPIDDGVLAHHFAPVSRLFAADLGSGSEASVMDRYLLLLRGLKVRFDRFDRFERGVDVGKQTKQLLEETVTEQPNEITRLRTHIATHLDTSQAPLIQSLQRLFSDPPEFAIASLRAPAAAQIAQAWGEQVASPWQRMVAGRYPVSDSGNEASVRDLRFFVDPRSGLLVGFERDEIGELDAGDGANTPLIDPRIHTTIREGSAIGDVLESLADVENGFEIMIEPSANLTAISLTIDGQTQDYRNGPQHWQRFTWPGETRSAGARIDVVSAGGQRITVVNFPTRWGLLRMIDSAAVSDVDSARQRFTWHTSLGPVSFVVRNFGGVKLTDLNRVRRLSVPTVAGGS